MSRSVKVSQLKKGDVLASTGLVLEADPVRIDNWCGQKNRARVDLSDGKVHIWGYFSTVKIKDTQN